MASRKTAKQKQEEFYEELREWPTSSGEYAR